MNKYITIHIFVFMLLVLSFNACTKKETKQEVNTKDTTSAFKTDKVQLRYLKSELQFTGQITFNQKKVSDIYTPTSGKVLAVNVELGKPVSQGQVLATIESTDISQYQKDLATASANFDIAKKNYDNTEALYNAKFSSSVDLTNSKKQLEMAQAELQRASDVIKLYGGGNKDKSVFMVKAPLSGFVVARNINPNMQIRSDNSNSLFTISDLNEVWVLINIYESDIQNVRIGQQVEISTIAYPGKTFEGNIENISQVLDNDSKVLQARVTLKNPAKLLKPDMFCSIKLQLDNDSGQHSVKLLSINSKSVIFNSDKYYVIQDLGKGKYKTVQVQVLRNTGSLSYIQGDLKEGDLVVTEGALLLFDELNNY